MEVAKTFIKPRLDSVVNSRLSFLCFFFFTILLTLSQQQATMSSSFSFHEAVQAIIDRLPPETEKQLGLVMHFQLGKEAHGHRDTINGTALFAVQLRLCHAVWTELYGNYSNLSEDIGLY